MLVPYEEWEVLYRLRLQVERDLLANELPRSPAERVATREERSLLGRLVAAVLGLPFALAAVILGRLVPGSPPGARER